jgi:hypothetical protein
MHLVLLYINKLMVCIFEFLQCAFVYSQLNRATSLIQCYSIALSILGFLKDTIHTPILILTVGST